MNNQAPGPVEAQTDVELLDAYSQAVTSVVEQVGPSVVSINIHRRLRTPYRPVDMEGAGSGMVLAPEGYIVTNYHVVDGSHTLIVGFTNGRTLPANTARWVTDELITHGRVRRAYLGIAGQTVFLPPVFQRFLSLDQQTAIGVLNVVKRGAADEASMRAGDVILSLNGQPTKTMDDLLRLLSKEKSGEKVRLDVVRSGMRAEIELSLGETK